MRHSCKRQRGTKLHTARISQQRTWKAFLAPPLGHNLAAAVPWAGQVKDGQLLVEAGKDERPVVGKRQAGGCMHLHMGLSMITLVTSLLLHGQQLL